jgi:hypothetical protein
MKCRIVGIVVAMLFFIVSPVHGQNDVEYAIQAGADGSASWLITQSGTDIRVSPDNLTQFQNNVTALLKIAENVTGRQMSAQAISITSTISGSYVVVQYRFIWQNFSTVEGPRIMIGDIFNVTDLFLRLQGDGEVVLNYPSSYEPETVSPAPFSKDDSHQTIMWLGTKNLVGETARIVLRMKPLDFLEIISRNSVLILGLIAAVASTSSGLYLYKRRNKMEKRQQPGPEPSSLPANESDEDRIVRLLKSSQGSVRQSTIVEQCKFSKAKTSQLLTALESRGIIRREKKGRDKIVILTEQTEGASNR